MANEAHQRFSAALEALVEQVKRDRSVLAAILCGSLSHDTVWDKSDIDLVLVTIDDKKIAEEASSALYADGINVHAMLLPRAEFRKMVEGSIRNSFTHSFLAKGRLLYTHDETIADLCAQLHAIGERDYAGAVIEGGRAARCRPSTRRTSGSSRAAIWITRRSGFCTRPRALAKIEVLERTHAGGSGSAPAGDEVEPGLFQNRLHRSSERQEDRARTCRRALTAIDDYLASAPRHSSLPVIDHLREVGEARSATEIEDHFQRNYGIEGVTGACEYLADQGLIGKAPLPVRLTKKSNVDVEELAFFHTTKAADAW